MLILVSEDDHAYQTVFATFLRRPGNHVEQHVFVHPGALSEQEVA